MSSIESFGSICCNELPEKRAATSKRVIGARVLISAEGYHILHEKKEKRSRRKKRKEESKKRRKKGMK